MPSFMDLDTIDQVVEQLSQMELHQSKMGGKENNPNLPLVRKAILKRWRQKRNIKNTLLLIKLREI